MAKTTTVVHSRYWRISRFNEFANSKKKNNLLNSQHGRLELEKAVNTLESKKAEDYQRVVRFNESGSLVATGTTDGRVQVFKYPDFESVSQAIAVSKDDEVLDVDINLENEKLTCVLRDGLKLINLRGKNVGQVVQTISSATIIKKSTAHFRAFR